MESTTILAIAAMVCFVVYYEMVTSSYIEHVSQSGIKVSAVADSTHLVFPANNFSVLYLACCVCK